MSDGESAAFAAWVRELRRRLGLTPGELGRRAGRSAATVAQWELGRCDAGRAVRATMTEPDRPAWYVPGGECWYPEGRTAAPMATE